MHSRPPASTAARRASAIVSGFSRSRAPRTTIGAPAAAATTAPASGPHTTSGRRVCGRQERRDLGDRLRAPDRGLGLDLAQPRPGRGVAQLAGPEQERHEPVGDLDRAVGERRRRVGRHQPDGAAAGEAAAGLKAGEHVGGVDSLARQQLGGQPRAGQPAGDVVLEVGVEAAVAGLELGCHAQREHRAVQRVEVRGAPPPRRGRAPGDGVPGSAASETACSSEMYSPRRESLGSLPAATAACTAACTRPSRN